METISLDATHSLRNLYFVRTAFQVVWAATVITTAITQPLIAAVLFSPLSVCGTLPARCTTSIRRADRGAHAPRKSSTRCWGWAPQSVSDSRCFVSRSIPVAVFGVWAFGAGLLQLVLGLIRRKQLGGGSVGDDPQRRPVDDCRAWRTSLGGLYDKRHIKDVGGYAVFGAIYFLIGGILLTRKLSKLSMVAAS